MECIDQLTDFFTEGDKGEGMILLFESNQDGEVVWTKYEWLAPFLVRAEYKVAQLRRVAVRVDTTSTPPRLTFGKDPGDINVSLAVAGAFRTYLLEHKIMFAQKAE